MGLVCCAQQSTCNHLSLRSFSHYRLLQIYHTLLGNDIKAEGLTKFEEKLYSDNDAFVKYITGKQHHSFS
jgi:hypothetical protein